MSEEIKNDPPLQTLRDGAVVAKIWRQESPEHGAFPSVTIGRTYKDKATGEYQESRSFSGTDVLKAQALLGEAHREAVKWRQYFREIDRQKGAPEPEEPEAVAERNAALQQQLPGSEAEPEANNPTMAQQRDAAMANAAPAEKGPGHERSREP